MNPAQPAPIGDFLELIDLNAELDEEVQEIAIQLPPPIQEEESLLNLPICYMSRKYLLYSFLSILLMFGLMILILMN